MLTESDGSFVFCASFREVAERVTFSFTDPVEDLFLTESDDSFFSTSFFREVAEIVYSVSDKVKLFLSTD